MSNTNIDNLTGADLDAAVAEAMEPKPDGLRGRVSAWWDWRYDIDKKLYWFPRRPLDGNVAVDLLEKLREWGRPIALTDRGRYEGQRFHASAGDMFAQAGDFPTACARLFLKIAAQRKGER